MNTDRELLELAAKAAGMNWCGWDKQYTWNPLADDGDALRLAVRLRFHICPISLAAVATIKCPLSVEIWREEDDTPLIEHYSDAGDICEATRRAIVRAAAEIGRTA